MKLEGEYSDGLQDGEWHEFYPNSQLLSTTVYSSGCLNGIAIKYYPTGEEGYGNVSEEATYNNGRLDSSLNFTTEYEGGSQTGGFISYFFPKPLQAAGTEDPDPEKNYRKSWGRLVESLKEGVWYEVWGNGETRRVGNYSQSLEDGIWKVYTEQGLLTCILQYENGEVVSSLLDCHLDTVYCSGDRPGHSLSRDSANPIVHERK